MLNIEPIELSDEDEGTVSSILDGWINQALQSRRAMEETWQEDLRDYESTPRTATKNFPWAGASNLVIPLKAIFVDSIQANLHTAIFSQLKLWTARVEDPNALNQAHEAEDFMDQQQRTRLNLRHRAKAWEFESVLLGTGFAKGMWLDDREIVPLPLPGGGTQLTEVLHHYGPWIDHIPIEDVVVPIDARSINGPTHLRCQFVDHVSHLRWDQLKSREDYGYKVPADLEDEGFSDWSRELKDLRASLRGQEYIRREGFDIHELWCRFPIHELKAFPRRRVKDTAGKTLDRKFAEVIFTYHPKSRTILRTLENWNHDGRRPFFALPYIARTNSIYGVGVGRMIHHVSEGVSTIHNQRIDNSTLANTRIWKARKGAIPRGTQVFPGKVLWMDNPKEDLMGEQLGEVYPSSFENENVLRAYGERRTGVSDYRLGREDPTGKYSATATSTLALLRQSTEKLDFVVDEWRDVFSELGSWTFNQYKQYEYHKTGLLEREFGPERAKMIAEAMELQGPQPDMAVYKFDLTVTTAAISKEADLQKNQILFDIIERFYMQAIQLTGMVTAGVDQAGVPITDAQKEVVMEALAAGLALFRRILYAFDIKDIESYLPNSERLGALLSAGVQPLTPATSQVPAQGGGGPTPPPQRNGGAGPAYPAPTQ